MGAATELCEPRVDGMLSCLSKTAAKIGIKTPVQHAIFSGYVSVATGIAEASMSVVAGEDEDSSSLLGISIMAVAEITGSLLVLYRWRVKGASPVGDGSSSSAPVSKKADQIQELYFAGAIGFMTACLGAYLFYTSFIDLMNDTPTDGVAAGIYVSMFGATCSFLLYAYKRHYGKVLKSMVLLADAKCSLCVGLISLAVVAALVLEELVSWADSMTGIFLSVYIMREGIFSLWESREKLIDIRGGDEGWRMKVPVMHERGDKGASEETALLEETM